MIPPTAFTKERIEQYKQIYREEYGKEISDQQALTEFMALVNYMNAVWKFINKDNL